MAMRIDSRAFAVVAHLAALWPTFRWWFGRIGQEGDEIWGLLGCPIALVMALPKKSAPAKSLVVPVLGLLLYAATYKVLPPLAIAVIGVTSFVGTCSALYFGCTMSWPLCVALLLGLPLEASLQFYLGYPLRFVVAALAAPMLSTLGFDVVALGTQLSWASLEVSVDGPCSGIRMLRMGLLFSCLLSLRYSPPFHRFMQNLGFSIVALVFANTIRACSLFIVELTKPPWSWLHAGVGVAAFGLMLIILIVTHMPLNKQRVALVP